MAKNNLKTPDLKKGMVRVQKKLKKQLSSVKRSNKIQAAKNTWAHAAPLGLALIVIFLGYSLLLSKDRFQQAKERLVSNPNDFEAHLVLAEEYLNNHQFSRAEKELLLAENSLSLDSTSYQTEGGDVLGISNYLIERLWQRKNEEDPQEIKGLIREWENIVAIRPDYRDGYLRLALYHYKLSENKEARANLQKALDLDPNNEVTKEIEKILE
jgi:tetratricopeptide (TPR) repeat protein